MTLQVIGYTWEGFLSTHSYSVTGSPADFAQYHQVKKVAGDFSDVTDWQLVRTDTRYKTGKGWSEVTTRTTILRPWGQPGSAEKFNLGLEGL